MSWIDKLLWWRKPKTFPNGYFKFPHEDPSIPDDEKRWPIYEGWDPMAESRYTLQRYNRQEIEAYAMNNLPKEGLPVWEINIELCKTWETNIGMYWKVSYDKREKGEQ